MRKIMWEWTVATLDPDQQVEAAVAGGFDVLTLSYRKYLAAKAVGRSAKDLAAYASDRNITLDFLDAFSGWAPMRYPPGADEFLRNALDFGAEEAFDLCDQAGLRNICAITGFPPGLVPLDQLVDGFGRFCDQAAERGIWVDLEPLSMMNWSMTDALEILRQANRPNAGLMFDTWHFMRCGAEFDLLETLLRGTIVNVQIVDGRADPGEDVWEDAHHHRELPGYGELPITKILAILRDTQDLLSVGPEAISDRLNALPAAEQGRQSREALDAALRKCGMVAA